MKAQKKGWQVETENAEFHVPEVPFGNRNLTVKNSHTRSSSGGMQLPLPTLDLPNSQNFSEMREEIGQNAESLCTSDTTLENALSAPNDAPGQRKSTRKNFGQKPHRFRDQLYV